MDRDLDDNLTLSNLQLENRAKSQERKKMETGSRKTGVMSLTKNISKHFSSWLLEILWEKLCKSILIALFIRFYFISLAIPFSILLYVSSLFCVSFYLGKIVGLFFSFIHFSLKISSYFMNSIISDDCKIYNISVFKCPTDISFWSPQAILIHHDSIPQNKIYFTIIASVIYTTIHPVV